MEKQEEIAETKLVWHYTSLGTLAQVLTSRTLFATEVSFLNDINETSAAEVLFERALKGLEGKNPRGTSGLIRDIRELSVVNDSSAMRLDLFEEHDRSRFVLCASEDPDSLYAWRTYASKSDVSCAIGLDPVAALRPHTATGNEASGAWQRVSYDTDRLFQSAVQRLEQIAAEHQDSVKSGHDSWASVFSAMKIRDDFVSLYKDPSFAQEQEFRVTHTTPNMGDLKFVTHPMGPRPHLPVGVRSADAESEGGWGLLPIREIKLGPGAPASALSATRWLLEANGYFGKPQPVYSEDVYGQLHKSGYDSTHLVKVTQSGLPYREA